MSHAYLISYGSETRLEFFRSSLRNAAANKPLLPKLRNGRTSILHPTPLRRPVIAALRRGRSSRMRSEGYADCCLPTAILDREMALFASQMRCRFPAFHSSAITCAHFHLV